MNGASTLRPGWVILTMGDRPDQLVAALDSVLAQEPEGPVLVVAQGATVAVPTGIDVLTPTTNLGIPGGRDAGLQAIDADIVFFLDDDAAYADPHVATRALETMRLRPDLGAISLRIIDEHGATLRRHVPRLGTRGAHRSGPVTSFLGGACAVRRTAYLDAGGYHAAFFYGHEEMDLAWRMLDAGYTVEYDAAPAVVHPHVPIAASGGDRWRLLGRNRVWLARRRLPHPIDWLHTAIWLAAEMARAGSSRARRAYWHGWKSGWSGPVDRRPISWRTVYRMGRLGRPPII